MNTGEKIQDLELRLVTMKERRVQILSQLERETQEDVRLKRHLAQYEKVRDHLVAAGNDLRRHVTRSLEDLVTLALQSVYKSKAYRFCIDVTAKGRRLNVDMTVRKGEVEGDIEDTFGGGVADVVSTMLRLAVAERFGVEGPIFLDEPGKMMDAPMLSAFAEMLYRYSHENDRQLIMATRAPQIADRADVALEVTQRNGKSAIS